MDQEKIGKFLLESRKQKGMTQKELAEKVGVSDKTISKWECGNSIPDISYLESLCNSLDISMNEFLSGERLTEASYSEKAEENIMALMKENESNKKSGFWRMVLGIALAIGSFMILQLAMGFSIGNIFDYYDAVGIISFTVMCIASVVASGKKEKLDVLTVLQKTSIPNGVALALFEFIMILRRLDDLAILGPSIAVCTLSVFYAVLTYWVVTIMKERCAE